MKRHLLLLGFQVLYILCLLNPEIVCGQTITPGSKVKSNQAKKFETVIRAAYWGLRPIEQAEEQLHLLKAHGLNTALLKDGFYRLKEDLWREWGDHAAKHDIRIFPVLNFAGDQELKHIQGKFIRYTDQYGRIFQSTPCPLDANYWNIVIGTRFEQLAHLSKTTRGIAGIAFDTEMYGGDFSIYTDLCFCDSCWAEFMKAKQQNALKLSPKKRFDYLVRHKLFEQYKTFQIKRLQDILSLLEQRIHRINPNLSIGIVGFMDNWFYKGLIHGLGTTTRPVIVFSETTYVKGFTPYVMGEYASITGTQPPISQYVPGLWLGRFFPEDISSQLYNLAIHTGGYWIFSANSFWDDEPTSATYALHGSKREYWSALKKTNNELARFFRSSDSYQSELPAIHLSSCYDTSQNRLVTQPSLKHYMHNIALISPPGSSESSKFPKSGSHNTTNITYRNKTLFHCFNNGNGSIEISHVPIGSYKDSTSYKIFDSGGRLFQKGHVSKQTRSVNITLPPHTSGLVSLLINSGSNAAHVSFSELPFVIEASGTFPLETINTIHAYFVYVNQKQERLKLRAYCSKNEFASLTILSPNNRIVRKVDIVGFTEIKVPIFPTRQFTDDLQPNGDFWSLRIEASPSKAFEDLRFCLYNEEFPYIIPGN